MTRKKAVEIVETWNKNLEDGATIEGYFEKTELYDSKYGETNKYIIKLEDGTKKAIFGSASLDAQFKNVPEGCYIWVEYKGEEQSKSGRPVKVYSVEYDDEKTL